MMDFFKSFYRIKNVIDQSLPIKTVGKYILFTVCLVRCVIELFYLILQCLYLILLQSSDGEASKTNCFTIDQVQELMRSFGSLFRAIKTAGIFYNSLFILNMSCYYLTRILPAGHSFDYITGNRLFLFFSEPKSEEKRMKERIDKCLHQIINSNINFMRAITGESVASKLNEETFQDYELQTEIYSQRYISDILGPLSPPNGASGLRLESISAEEDELMNCKNHSPFCACEIEQKPFGCNDWVARSVLVYSLNQQLKHLTKLTLNKCRVWPPNRNQIYANEIKSYWLKFYLISTVMFWLGGQVFTSLAIYLSREALKDGSRDEKYQRFTLLDRCHCIEYHIFTFFSLEWFFVPITILLTGIKDQMSFLRSLKPKLQQICSRIRRLENFQNNGSQSIKSDFKLVDEIRRDMQFECDKEAIELYIGYYLCRDEVGALIETVQKVMNRSVFYMTFSLLPMLAFFSEIPLDHLSIFVVTIFAILGMINLGFYMCAMLNASCCRVAKLPWSLVAFSEGHTSDRYEFFRKHSLRHKQSNFGYANSSPLINEITESHNSRLELDFEYYSHSAIHPHTILLWRRLIENVDLFNDRLVCKLYGVFNINFAAILRFNYLLLVGKLEEEQTIILVNSCKF